MRVVPSLVLVSATTLASPADVSTVRAASPVTAPSTVLAVFDLNTMGHTDGCGCCGQIGGNGSLALISGRQKGELAIDLELSSAKALVTGARGALSLQDVRHLVAPLTLLTGIG